MGDISDNVEEEPDYALLDQEDLEDGVTVTQEAPPTPPDINPSDYLIADMYEVEYFQISSE